MFIRREYRTSHGFFFLLFPRREIFTPVGDERRGGITVHTHTRSLSYRKISFSTALILLFAVYDAFFSLLPPNRSVPPTVLNHLIYIILREIIRGGAVFYFSIFVPHCPATFRVRPSANYTRPITRILFICLFISNF